VFPLPGYMLKCFTLLCCQQGASGDLKTSCQCLLLQDVDFAPIPNDVFPSDHLAMAAVLALSSPENSL
jgi:hypothetical protein